MNRKSLIILAGLVSALSSGAASAAVVATVNNSSIDTKDLTKEYSQLNDLQKDRLNKDANTRREIVEGAINAELLFQAAKKAGVENDEEYKQAVERFKRQFLATRYMQKNLEPKVNNSAVKDFFNSHKGNYDSTQVRAMHILVSSEAEAKKLLSEVQKAKDEAAFAAIAKKNSLDPTVAENGGDLGFFTRDRMVPEFASAAFKMREGETKGPVKSPFGYHIIRVIDIKHGRVPNFDEVEARVREDLRQSLAQDMIKKLRDQAQIKVNDDAVKSMRF